MNPRFDLCPWQRRWQQCCCRYKWRSWSGWHESCLAHWKSWKPAASFHLLTFSLLEESKYRGVCSTEPAGLLGRVVDVEPSNGTCTNGNPKDDWLCAEVTSAAATDPLLIGWQKPVNTLTWSSLKNEPSLIDSSVCCDGHLRPVAHSQRLFVFTSSTNLRRFTVNKRQGSDVEHVCLWKHYKSNWLQDKSKAEVN